MTTIPEKSVQTQVQLNYKPSDFFYYNSNLTPSLTDCSNLMIFSHCDETDPSWNDISFNCYRKELCVNKNLANEVLRSHTTNLETETRKNDIELVYNHSKLYSLNLMGGIVTMFVLMWALPSTPPSL
jgi:hypothetical protein